MLDSIILLFAWMPPPLPAICGAAVVWFIFTSLLHLWSFFLDLIPFA